MRMPPMKAKSPAPAKPPTRKMSSKPHIRMQKLRPVPQSAFPTAPAAFPTDGAAPGPDQAMGAGPGAMPSGAAPGDTGE